MRDEFHFRETVLVDYLPDFEHIFHTCRLEDYVDKLSFPLAVHRKVVYDMIFLVEGTSTRSKGLNQHDFHKNEIFFLPFCRLIKSPLTIV